MAGAVPDERGVSLIELLVAMAMAGLVMAATVTLLLAGHAAHTVGTARAEATQSARVALERMGSELRQAGYDPQGTRFEPILVAEPARVTLQRDLNENGVIDPPGSGSPISFAAPCSGARRAGEPSPSPRACRGSG
jgi:prepilin-type N-terminal cleavage/methylation domain-containing protein